MTSRVARHKTALIRSRLSRPIAIALETGVLVQGRSFFDFGCGRGSDLALLAQMGFEACGWDPAFFPTNARRRAEVVNLGYVVNVIEEPTERTQALRAAWELTERTLIVAARPLGEDRDLRGAPYQDGILTSAGTFQKLYSQEELRTWIGVSLDAEPVAVAPGVFFIFRDRTEAHALLAARFRRRFSVPSVETSEALFSAHRELLEPLIEFVAAHGRVPSRSELTSSDEIHSLFGSLQRAFAVVTRVTGTPLWDRVRRHRGQDLLVYLALSRFRGRPRFGDLVPELQLDIRTIFGSYLKACHLADALLLRVGRSGEVEKLCASSEVGKLTPNALYVHVSAIDSLHPILRVYEGCARVLVGLINEGTVVKLHRRTAKVSYLSYPAFDKDAHPALAAAFVADLRSLDVEARDYRARPNPPVLHRKEAFVTTEYPRFGMFSRLTLGEERAGLLDDTQRIGTREGWALTLRLAHFRLRGHTLQRSH